MARPMTGLKGKVEELAFSLHSAETNLDANGSQQGWGRRQNAPPLGSESHKVAKRASTLRQARLLHK